MPLPDDLKNFEADSFQLIPPDIAGVLLLALLAVLLLLDATGRLF